MKTHAFRLKPNLNLREELLRYTKSNKITASAIVTLVAGLKEVEIRMPGATPDKQDIRTLKEDLEIVSAEGTLSADDCHIHIAVANKNGEVTGGHFKEGITRITAEVVLVELEDKEFARELDPDTGFKELVVKDR